MDELRDFFLAENRRQAMGPFRIGSFGNAPGFAESLDVEEPQAPPGVVLRNSLTTCASGITRLDIRECVEGLSDLGNS